MRTLDCKAAVLKAGTKDGLEDGEIIALVSVFNNIDSYGDVVMPGAFAEDLKAWEASGDQIPYIWSHDWADPFSHIGVVRSAEETEKGLLVRAYISPEERELNPKAAQVHRLQVARRVTQFSFAFDLEEGGWATRKAVTEQGDEVETEVYELRKMKIHEVGPCLLGVNQETQLIAAKAKRLAGLPTAGRDALKNLTAARDQLNAIIEGHTQETSQPAAKAAGEGEGRTETEPANGETRPPAGKGVSPASAMMLAELAELETE